LIKFHIVDFHDLLFSPCIIGLIKHGYSGACGKIENGEKCLQHLSGDP